MSRSLIFIISILVFISIFFASFFIFRTSFQNSNSNSQSNLKSENKLKITTSFYALQQISSQVAGEKAEVISITPAGMEAHDFVPTAQDRVLIEESDLFVFQGSDFDPWAQKIAEDKKVKESLEFSTGVKFLEVSDSAQNEEETDPHIWLNPIIVKTQSQNILQKLKQIDPNNSGEYEKNYQDFAKSLEDLDKSYKVQLSSCKRDTIVVSHNAYSYLSDAYKFKTKAIQGLSTLDSPTTSQIAEIISFINREKIKYIMLEEVVSNSVVNQVKAQTKVEFLPLSPLESVDEENQSQTYEEAMKKNLGNLRIALECN